MQGTTSGTSFSSRQASFDRDRNVERVLDPHQDADDRRRGRAVVALARDARVLVVAVELALAEDDAVRLDVRVTELTLQRTIAAPLKERPLCRHATQWYVRCFEPR